jgi:LPS export ABC transporter protein LptC
VSTRILTIALAGAIGLAACGETAAPPPVQNVSQLDSADNFLVGVTTKVIDGGVLRADVEADSAYLFDNNARATLMNATMTFMTSTGVKDGIMTADLVKYDMRADSLHAYGNVHVTTTNGETLVTPYLRYSKSANEVSTDSAFTLTGPDRNLQGIGFVSDPGLNSIQVKQLIRGSGGTVQIPKK